MTLGSLETLTARGFYKIISVKHGQFEKTKPKPNHKTKTTVNDNSNTATTSVSLPVQLMELGGIRGPGLIKYDFHS